jgi:protein O-mannosyl-transferase
MKKIFNNYFKIILSVILFFTIIIVFLPSLKNGFIHWDDPGYITINKTIQTLSFKNIKAIFLSFTGGLWIPITFLTFTVIHIFSGLNPLGYHLTNNLIHAANAILVFYLFLSFFRIYCPEQFNLAKKNKYILLASFFGALFWAIHPLRVESVAWATELKDVLSGFFYLATCLFYLKFKQVPKDKDEKKWYVFSLIFFILSLLSKPMAVTLPIILLIFDLFVFNNHIKKAILEKMPFFIVSGLISMLTMVSMHKGLAPVRDIDFYQRFLNFIKSIVFYFEKTLYPINLVPIYPFDKPISLGNPIYLISSIVFIIIFALSLWLYRKKKFKIPVFVFICFIIAILPVSGIFQNGQQSSADRFTYIPSLGIFFLFCVLLKNIFKYYEHSKIKIYSVIIFILFLGSVISFKTINQFTIWKDDITFWGRIVNLYPERSFSAHSNLAAAYYEKGMLKEAMKQCELSIKIDSNTPAPFMTLGKIYFQKNDLEKALYYFKKAGRIKPSLSTHENIALVYEESGKIKEAFNHYQIAFRLKNRFPLAMKLADYYISEKNFYWAKKVLLAAVDLKPEEVGAHNNLGIAYAMLGDPVNTRKQFDMALSLDTNYRVPNIYIGIAYFKNRDLRPAEFFFKKELKSNPTNYKAKEYLEAIHKIRKKQT